MKDLVIGLILKSIQEQIYYLDWSETQVLYTESRLINCLSVLDITKFLKCLAIKLYMGELQKNKFKKRKKKKIYKKSKQ